jgi:hypothetical protein
MSKAAQEAVQEMGIEGLLLRGTVVGRTRRNVGEKMKELVTYKIATNREGSREIFLKEWEPNGKYFTVGEAVCVPVTVKMYTKEGRALCDYTLYKGNRMMGEEF